MNGLVTNESWCTAGANFTVAIAAHGVKLAITEEIVLVVCRNRLLAGRDTKP